MRTSITIAAIFLLAGLAAAQSAMPVPPFGSTYSIATHTRGFYFQAPLDFTIVGLRVPDETKHGLQNVAVIKPPTQPSSTNQTGGLQFYKGGEPSAKIIPCNVPFKKGEWVGVLGACGDANMMHNSYGTGSSPFTSSVAGQTVSIHRFCTNTNLVAQQGKGSYWTNVFNIGRVEVYTSTASLVGSGTGAPGTAINFTLTSASDAGLPYQMGGAFGNGPIPIDTRTLGLSADPLLALSVGGTLPSVFQNYAGTLDANGKASANLNIPPFPVLKGLRIYNAFVTLRATAPSGVASISDTFSFQIR